MHFYELQMADEGELADAKEWFFAENIRLSEENEKLEEEKRRFEREKNTVMDELNGKIIMAEFKARQLDEKKRLLEEQLELIRQEYDRIEAEKKKIEQERETFEKIKSFRRSQGTVTYSNMDFLFKGVRDTASLKKRYRELLKIFHPDNFGGDNSAIQSINKEYERLRNLYD